MAVLEFEFKGIDQNFRSSASNVLKDIDKIKKAFGSIGVGEINVSGIKKSMDEVTASIKKAESDNKMFLANEMNQAKVNILQVSSAVKNDLSSSLNQAKVNFVEAKKATQDMVTEGKNLDNQYKQTKVAIAELTLEQKKLTAEQRASRANLQDSPYSKLSRELNEMRNEAKNLGAQMILLDSAGMKTSSTYNTLENRFKQVQKETLNLDNSIKKLDSDLGQNNRRVGAYGNALGGLQQKTTGANGVTLEFNRIIQDLPFGMMGIGNNLQQLSENWKTYTAQAKASAQANGTTISSMGLLRGALAGIFSPLNLLSLGVSVATSGWVLYEKWQQKANKATKEAKDEMDKLRDSLSKYNQAMADGEAKGKIEEARLNRLMSIYKDLSQSQKTRKNAYQEIMSMYESYFGKLNDEEKKAFNLTKAYDKLSVSILKTAKARAFQDIIEQNIKDIEVLNKSIEGTSNSIIKSTNALNKYNKETKATDLMSISGQGGNINVLNQGLKVSADLNNSLIENKKLVDQRNKLTAENYNYEQRILDLTQEGAKVTEVYNEGKQKATKTVKDQRDYLLEIQQILQNSQSRVDTSGEILNWDKELIKVHDYYDKQEIALQKMLVSSQRAYKKDSAKRQQIEQAINSTRITLHNNMINELSKIDDKYFSEGMAKVAELNAKYSDSMDLDTRSNALKKVRDEFTKLREEFKNDPIISQEMLDKWQENQTLKVNWEFDNKDLEEWGKLNDRIQETIDKPFNGKNQKSIQAELDRRIAILKKTYEQLIRATGGEFNQGELDRLIGTVTTNATIKVDTREAEKDIQDYVNIAMKGMDSVFGNLKSNIDEFGLKASSIFYGLGETISDMLKQIANKNTAKFMEKLTKDAKSFGDLGKNWKEMSSQDKWSAGLGFSGSAVSGLTPQTSSGGQAIGGALSGAAAGMAFGPWGAAIGAVAGGVSGLLKAAKNKRQEKILLKQYEEQKKANALLERMSALTYASQIIGQKTEYGIVSGVRRNEYGQIVSVVQGQDIVMVADRTDKNKNR